MSSLQRTISRALAVKGLNQQQKEQRRIMRKKLKEAKKAWRKDN